MCHSFKKSNHMWEIFTKLFLRKKKTVLKHMSKLRINQFLNLYSDLRGKQHYTFHQ